MDVSSPIGTFECPAGFLKEELMSQLYLEDIDDESELWLVRIPSDVEPSVIQNKIPTLNPETSPNVLEMKDGKILECFAQKCEKPNLCLVLPSKNHHNRLTEVQKKFKGSILITEYPALNQNVEVKDETDCGADQTQNNPEIAKRKNKSSQLDTEQTSDYAPVTKKKKSKSKNKKDRDVDLKPERESDLDDFPKCNTQK